MMNHLRKVCCLLIMVIAILLPASAVSSGGNTNQTINNEFIVALPSDWSNFPVSSYTGASTGLMDNQDTSNVIAVQVSVNSNCSTDNKENLRVNLEDYNARSGFANLSKPEYGNDTVLEYGKFSDGKYAYVFLRLDKGNVVTVAGPYQSEADAKSHEDIFKTISESVYALNPVTNDICEAVLAKPTSTVVQTYVPRVYPTVSNNTTPTITPKANLS